MIWTRSFWTFHSRLSGQRWCRLDMDPTPPWEYTLGSGRIRRIYRHLIFGSASSTEPFTTASPTEVVRPDRWSETPCVNAVFRLALWNLRKRNELVKLLALSCKFLQILLPCWEPTNTSHPNQHQISSGTSQIVMIYMKKIKQRWIRYVMKCHQQKFSWALPSYRVNKKWGESGRKRNSKKK